jgi:hypothetical protein
MLLPRAPKGLAESLLALPAETIVLGIASVLLLVDAALFIAAIARFKRARLILE